MRWLSIVGIALANNLDNAGIGVAFGIARIRVSFLVNLWIALLTFVITVASTVIGSHLASFIAFRLARVLSAFILGGMGVWMILPSLRGQRESPEPTDRGKAPSLQQILVDPTRADRNESRDIDFREAAMVAVAASRNNVGGGLVAGLVQLSAFWTAFLSALVSFLALWLGDRAGQRLGATRLAESANVIAGVLLLVIGLASSVSCRDGALIAINTGICAGGANVRGTGVPPPIFCPADITVGTAPNQCSAVGDYPAPTGGDTAGPITCVPPPGSTFPLVSTPVTCTSAAGASCTFTVTVKDTQPPSITCPSNITVNTARDQCSALVSFAPTAADNCGTPAVVCRIDNQVITSPHTFPLGTTTVACTATDAAGNSNNCSFTVTVNDTEKPTLTCLPDVLLLQNAGQRFATFFLTGRAS